MTATNVKAIRKCEFNNYIVGQRSIVRQAVNHAINKLMRDADRLRRKKTINDLHKEKNKRRADRYIEELKYIKSLHPDDVSKFAVLCKKSYKEVGNDLNSSIEERALTMLSEYKLIQPTIKKFREEYPNWLTEVPDIIKSLGVNYRKKRLKSLAAKGKLDPVMEKERKLFLLLHEAAGLDVDPKMLRSKNSVISLNKKKRVNTKEPKPNNKKFISQNEGNSDTAYESEDADCEEGDSEENSESEDDAISEEVGAEENTNSQSDDAAISEEDDAEQNSEPEDDDCNVTNSEENCEPEDDDCDATNSEEDDDEENSEPYDAEESSETEDADKNSESEDVGCDSEEEDAEENSDSERADCDVIVSKKASVKENNFDTIERKRDSKEKIKLLKPKIIVCKKRQEIVPIVNRRDTNQCVANGEKDIKSRTRRIVSSQSCPIDKKLQNSYKKDSKNLKLKLLQSLESKTCKNMQKSSCQNEEGSIGAIDSIFSNIDETNIKDNKKCNFFNANSDSFGKKLPIRSYIKGTCKVKQIDLENETDLLKDPLIAILSRNDDNISSDDENYSNNHDSSNLERKRSSFFVGYNCNDVNSNNEDVDRNIRKRKVNKLKNYENRSTFFTSGQSNEKDDNDNSHGNQKQHNDGLNRFERRRQKFGPLEHRGEKRACSNKDNLVDDWALEASSHKRRKSDFGNWNNNQKNDKTKGNRGGAKRNFDGKYRTFSVQNSGSNTMPLGNRQPTNANKAPQESLLHPSWAAKKKEASLSSALNVFQGKKVTFDD